MDMVILKNVSKSFHANGKRVQVIKNLNLTIASGDFFSLLGPSGCGKTTIIRCIAGLETPDEGEIMIGGNIVFSSEKKLNVPAHKRNIGMVFQSYAIWPHMNVFENVAFPLKHGVRKKLTEKEVTELVEESLDLVSLHGYGSRPAPQLSGGQQQRVALARAIVARPEVILLDEPLSNLDAKLRKETRLELRQLFQKIGTTAIFVTHDQAEAFAVSDSVAVMNGGHIMQMASPQEIYLHPTSAFVADFVGRIFFLDAVALHQADGRLVAKTGIGDIECVTRKSFPPGKKLKLGIRPEQAQPAEHMGNEGVNCFKAMLRSSVFLGEYFDAKISIGNTELEIKMPPESSAVVGSEIDITFPARSWIIIDEENING